MENPKNVKGRAAVQAENILMAVDGGNKYYRTPIITAEEQLRAQLPVSQEESTGLSAQRMLEAFPNPAREIVHFHYRIPEGSEGAALSLFSSAGQRLATFGLAGAGGQLSWKANILPPGQYYYQLLLPNGQSETGKFIMLK